MAVVYRAVVDGPKGFAREVVIKRILRQFSDDPTFVNMLAREARLCGLLRHPNIVQVHEFSSVGSEYYLAMELVDGADLHTVLKTAAKQGLMPAPGLVCHIISELAGALAYAHALTDEEGQPFRIVHRDVSPSNVMLTRLGGVKLLDFGIAKAESSILDEETRTGALKGKISYMSPEQAEGLPLDLRSDLFSLGVVFYELLTLERLFKGQSDLETLRLVRQALVDPPRRHRQGLDPDIEAVVMKMLAADPRHRYASGEEVVKALAPAVHRHRTSREAVREFVAQLGPLPDRAVPLAPAPPPDTEAITISRGRAGSTREIAEPGREAGTVTGSLGELQSATASMPGQLSSRRKVIGAVAAAATLVLAGGLWNIAGPKQPRLRPDPPVTQAGRPLVLPALPPTAPEAPAERIAPPAETVQLRLLGPTGAEVLVDGRLVGELPIDVAMPKSPGQRTLTVQRMGFKTWSRVVAADADVTLTATLVRKRAATPVRTAPREPASTPGVPALADPFRR
jgi:serine/threonine-protein kinase